MKARIRNNKKRKLIESIIGETLFALGFSFFQFQDEGRRLWCFQRKKGDVTQVIQVGPDVVTALKNYLMIRTYTSAEMMPTDLTNIIDELVNVPSEHLFEDIRMGWEYTDQKSLISLLKAFQTIIVLYALPELERRSVIKEDIYVTTEGFLYMQENSSEIIQQYSQEWSLPGKGAEQQIHILSEQICKFKDKPFFSIDTELFKIAAVYGDVIIREFGGKWKWNDFSNNILVDEIGGTFTFTRPADCVIEEWKGEGSLLKDFYRVREEIPTSRPYPRRRGNIITELLGNFLLERL